MENSKSFDLKAALLRWRENWAGSQGVNTENLNEMEAHLKDSFARLQSCGLTAEESFLVAVRRLGSADELKQEFEKINAADIWRTRAIWMITGIFAFVVAADLAQIVTTVLGLMADHLKTSTGHLEPFEIITCGVGDVLVIGGMAWISIAFIKRVLPRVRVAMQRLLGHPWRTAVTALIVVIGLRILIATGHVAILNQFPSTELPGYFLAMNWMNMINVFLIPLILAVSYAKLVRNRLQTPTA